MSMGITLSLPAPGIAAMALPRAGQRTGTAGAAPGQGQQPCHGLSRTHHGFGGSLFFRNSAHVCSLFFFLLLKAGSHLDQQHIVTKAYFL